MEMSGTNLLWFFAFIFLMGNGGFGNFFGNNRIPMGPPPATQAELTAGLNNQSIMNELNALGLATQNNNYETARLISDQNLLMQTQNSTNQINVIQGFNQIASKIDGLSAQLATCCCEIKTQMLQDRLADAQAKNVALENSINNANQSQYILSQLGRFVAWTPSGSQATTAG